MRYNFFNLTLIALAAMMFASGCNKTEDNPNNNEDRMITFSTQVTKSPVTGVDDMNNFSVWGWCHKNGTKHVNLFNQTTVKPDGTYGEEQRFWAEGFTHDFYAVHPVIANDPAASTTCTVSEAGLLSIQSFSSSTNVDLMTASNTGIVYNSSSTKPAPVALNFTHELAKVKFTVTAAEKTEINAALFFYQEKGNMNKKLAAPTSVAEWNTYGLDNEGLSESITPGYMDKISIDKGTAIALFHGEILMIPQTFLKSQDRKTSFFISYYYEGESQQNAKEKVIHLTDIKDAKGNFIDKWEAGKSYNYILNIPENGVDVDITVTVSDWTDKDFSVTL